MKTNTLKYQQIPKNTDKYQRISLNTDTMQWDNNIFKQCSFIKSISLCDQYCPVPSFTEALYQMIVEEYGIFMGYVGYIYGRGPSLANIAHSAAKWPGLELENMNINHS